MQAAPVQPAAAPAVTAAASGPGPIAAARPLTGLLLAAAGAVAFAGKAIIVKLAYRYEGTDAVTLLMLRMLLALPLFALLAWWAGRGRPALSWRDRVTVLGLGFSGYYLASFLDFAGLAYISASLERLILYLTPTLVLAIGALRFGHRVTRRQLFALGVSYAGVALAFGREVTLEGRDVLLGSALVLGGTVSYAIYLVFSGAVVARLGALRLTGWATSVACVLCIAQYLLLRDPLALAALPAPVWWLSLLNATACTFAPVLMVMLAIERIGAGVTSQVGMVGPLATIGMGVWLLGEPFTPWLAAGTLLLLAGVALLTRPAPPATVASRPR